MTHRSIWLAAILVPLAVVIVLAAAIIGVGELYLAIHGTGAIIAAIVLMFAIFAIAGVFAARNEAQAGGSSGGGH